MFTSSLAFDAVEAPPRSAERGSTSATRKRLATRTNNSAATAKNAFRILMVDDHEAILNGTIPALQHQYPNAEILAVQDLASAQKALRKHPDLQLLILDLSIPENPSELAQRQVGIGFLKQFLHSGIGPNLVVLSTNIKPIFRFRSSVNAYEGGFALLDKREPLSRIIDAIALAMRGSIFWPKKTDLNEQLFPVGRIELDSQWIHALQLKFHQGLTDKAIAKRMKVSDRTIRNYWVRLQDSLGIPEDPDKDHKIEAWKIVYELGLVE